MVNYEHFMKELAKSKSLLDFTIHFYGRTPNISLQYRLSNVLLLTSDYEGTPNVVLEAMASGLVVILISVGDVPNIIEHGLTGFLVDRNSIYEMADYIDFLAENPQICDEMGMAARLLVSEKYGIRKLREALVKLYSPDLGS